MCTLLTIDNQTFKNNKDVILNHIKSDARLNPDGYSLLLLGSRNTFIQSLDITPILALVDNVNWNRMYLHCRKATRKITGLMECHGFSTISFTDKEVGYYVFHNGSITSVKAKDYRVDSMYIAEMIRILGLKETIPLLLKEEKYVNAFFVSPDNGHTVILRSQNGKLHTDGGLNYSTNPILNINQPVAVSTSKEYHVEKYNFNMIELDDMESIFNKENWLEETPTSVYKKLSKTQRGKLLSLKEKEKREKKLLYSRAYDWDKEYKSNYLYSYSNKYTPKSEYRMTEKQAIKAEEEILDEDMLKDDYKFEY